MAQHRVTIEGIMTIHDAPTLPPYRPPWQPEVPGSPGWDRPHPDHPIAGIPGISLPIWLPGMGWINPLPPIARPPWQPEVPGSPGWSRPHPDHPIAGIPGISLPIYLPGDPGWGWIPGFSGPGGGPPIWPGHPDYPTRPHPEPTPPPGGWTPGTGPGTPPVPVQPIAGIPIPGTDFVMYWTPAYGWVAVPASGNWSDVVPPGTIPPVVPPVEPPPPTAPPPAPEAKKK